jgi:hypothetical protein
MGINIYDMSSEFRVPKSRHSAALAAIRNLSGSETVTKAHFPALEGDDHYAFVTTKDFVDAETFFDAMIAWRWVLEEDTNGDAIDPSFTGEKLGDEEILFSAIAPFVEDHSYIQVFCHDDECVWRWVFEKSQVRREHANIVFNYPGANRVPGSD